MPKPDEILNTMAETFQERAKVYGDNYLIIGEVMRILFPNGTNLKAPFHYNIWHLFELMIVKLTRFANSSLSHTDSIHDLAVYAAMIESVLTNNESKKDENSISDTERLDAIISGMMITSDMEIIGNTAHHNYVVEDHVRDIKCSHTNLRDAIDGVIGERRKVKK